MDDDILMRLRKEISKRDRPNPVELLPELREAADEIELLRFERDFLSRYADECRETLTELRQRMETLTAERDEARRKACMCGARYMEQRKYLHNTHNEQDIERDAKQIAKHRGWDCFKEAGDVR